MKRTCLRATTGRPGTARGEVISSGKRVATARGTLTDSDGRPIAAGVTTCLVFPIGELARR